MHDITANFLLLRGQLPSWQIIQAFQFSYIYENWPPMVAFFIFWSFQYLLRPPLKRKHKALKCKPV